MLWKYFLYRQYSLECNNIANRDRQYNRKMEDQFRNIHRNRLAPNYKNMMMMMMMENHRLPIVGGRRKNYSMNHSMVLVHIAQWYITLQN
jgi:hypothetical protein